MPNLSSREELLSVEQNMARRKYNEFIMRMLTYSVNPAVLHLKVNCIPAFQRCRVWLNYSIRFPFFLFINYLHISLGAIPNSITHTVRSVIYYIKPRLFLKFNIQHRERLYCTSFRSSFKAMVLKQMSGLGVHFFFCFFFAFA